MADNLADKSADLEGLADWVLSSLSADAAAGRTSGPRGGARPTTKEEPSVPGERRAIRKVLAADELACLELSRSAPSATPWCSHLSLKVALVHSRGGHAGLNSSGVGREFRWKRIM